MRVTVGVIPLVILAGFALPAASGNHVLGKWNCVSVNNETGTKVAFVLDVKEDAGKLSASLTIVESGDEIPAIEPTVEGNTLSFRLRMNAQEIVKAIASIDGRQLTGTFQGRDSGTGTFKGVRAE